MPCKIRELIRDLERTGFVNRGGKGDHRNFVHPKVPKPVTLSGKPGDDARDYHSMSKFFVLDVLLRRVGAVSSDPAPASALAPACVGRAAGPLPEAPWPRLGARAAHPQDH